MILKTVPVHLHRCWELYLCMLPKSPCQQVWTIWCLFHVSIHSWNLRKNSFLQSPQQFLVWYVFRPCPACAVRGIFLECCDYGWSYSKLQREAHFTIHVISQWFAQSSLSDLEQSPPSQKSAITHQAIGWTEIFLAFLQKMGCLTRFVEIPEKGRQRGYSSQILSLPKIVC